MNKYLVKIAAFKTPAEVESRLQPAGFRNPQWDGKKTVDVNARMTTHAAEAGALRAERLTKAKSLLSKKIIKGGVKAGLIAAGAAGAYHLGKSILNNMEP